MLGLVGKGDNLCLYRGAIARAYALYLAIVERRVRESLAKNFAGLGIGVNDIAIALLERRAHLGKIGEMMEIALSALHLSL